MKVLEWMNLHAITNSRENSVIITMVEEWIKKGPEMVKLYSIKNGPEIIDILSFAVILSNNVMWQKFF